MAKAKINQPWAVVAATDEAVQRYARGVIKGAGQSGINLKLLEAIVRKELNLAPTADQPFVVIRWFAKNSVPAESIVGTIYSHHHGLVYEAETAT
ncbi:MAG: hypothetical protein WCT37_02435 [Patescibacteria group bacterium]|jgi:hypothetical protein